MNKLELNVAGMACTGCENRIKNAIKLIDNIINVDADYTTGVVIIKYDKDIEIEMIKQKIEDLGFEIK